MTTKREAARRVAPILARMLESANAAPAASPGPSRGGEDRGDIAQAVGE